MKYGYKVREVFINKDGSPDFTVDRYVNGEFADEIGVWNKERSAEAVRDILIMMNSTEVS